MYIFCFWEIAIYCSCIFVSFKKYEHENGIHNISIVGTLNLDIFIILRYPFQSNTLLINAQTILLVIVVLCKQISA